MAAINSLQIKLHHFRAFMGYEIIIHEPINHNLVWINLFYNQNLCIDLWDKILDSSHKIECIYFDYKQSISLFEFGEILHNFRSWYLQAHLLHTRTFLRERNDLVGHLHLIMLHKNHFAVRAIHIICSVFGGMICLIQRLELDSLDPPRKRMLSYCFILLHAI